MAIKALGLELLEVEGEEGGEWRIRIRGRRTNMFGSKNRHVISGIGGDHERAHGSVRFTLGRYNTMEEAEAVVDAISEVVETLRKISPLGKVG